MATKAKSQKTTNHTTSHVQEYLGHLPVAYSMARSTVYNTERKMNAIALRMNLEEMTLADVGSGILAIREQKPNYARSLLRELQRYTAWCLEQKYVSQAIADLILKIKLPKQVFSTKDKADMLSQEEINHIITVGCLNNRDRALMALIFDGALRAGEAIALNWGDLQRDANGIALTIRFKTEKPRYIRLVTSVEYINRYKAETRGSTAPGAPVFIDVHGKRLDRWALRAVMERIARRANLGKRVHLHLLRHSRINQMIDQHVPETIIKKIGWGSANTRTFGAVYEHMQTETIDDAILEAAGIKPRREMDRTSEAWECPTCRAILAPGTKFCSNDGTPRDSPVREEREITAAAAFEVLTRDMTDDVKKALAVVLKIPSP